VRVIRVRDTAGSETYDHKGELKEW